MGVGTCCDHLAAHIRASDFPLKDCLKDYMRATDDSGEDKTVNDVTYFQSKDGKLYLYRCEDGDWIIGSQLGMSSKGVLLRSQDPDRHRYIQECPCQTKVWQRKVGESWITEPELRIIIRKDANVLII